jgi:hypothetical protein
LKRSNTIKNSIHGMIPLEVVSMSRQEQSLSEAFASENMPDINDVAFEVFQDYHSPG